MAAAAGAGADAKSAVKPAPAPAHAPALPPPHDLSECPVFDAATVARAVAVLKAVMPKRVAIRVARAVSAAAVRFVDTNALAERAEHDGTTADGGEMEAVDTA